MPWCFSASLQSCLSCLRLTVLSLVRCIFPALWLLFLHPVPSAVDEVGLAQAAILSPASLLQLRPGKSPPLTMRSTFLLVQSGPLGFSGTTKMDAHCDNGADIHSPGIGVRPSFHVI